MEGEAGMESDLAGGPMCVGNQQGPRSRLSGLKNKREVSDYLAKHPGRGEVQLRQAATELGLIWEASPPIAHWYPDLVFRPIKLIVEVDGAVHFKPEQMYKDLKKDRALKKLGWKVVRVWAGDAKRAPMDVLLGAFTRAFGIGNEEWEMNRCKAPRKKKRSQNHEPAPGPSKRARRRAEKAARASRVVVVEERRNGRTTPLSPRLPEARC